MSNATTTLRLSSDQSNASVDEIEADVVDTHHIYLHFQFQHMFSIGAELKYPLLHVSVS